MRVQNDFAQKHLTVEAIAGKGESKSGLENADVLFRKLPTYCTLI